MEGNVRFCLMGLALIAFAGCGPSRNDQEYLRAMRPVAVQYAELIKDFNSYLPEDFVKFSDNIDALRRQAILVYPPSGRRLRLLNADFIDLLEKAGKAGFTFGTEFLDCEEQANSFRDYDKKVDVADKWRWEARESSREFFEAHQRLRPDLQKAFLYPVGDVDRQAAIDSFAQRLTQ